VDDKPIRIRSQIYAPDVVLVLDPSLVNIMDVTVGLKDGGTVVVNTTGSLEELAQKLNIKKGKIAVVDGTSIARKHIGRPITNTTMLGALIKATAVVNIEHMSVPLSHRFGTIAARNEQAMRAAYKEVIVKEIES